MEKILRKRDIDRMTASDVSIELLEYYNRLSEERKIQFSESRPDLFAALLDLEKTNSQNETSTEETQEITDADQVNDESSSDSAEPVVTQHTANSPEYNPHILDAISHNAYEGMDIPKLINTVFTPVEALTIDDKVKKCPAHRTPLVRFNPIFRDQSGRSLGRYFYYCQTCNRLFIYRSRYIETDQYLNEWGVPHNFYDYDLSRLYLQSQITPYILSDDEKIFIPDLWTDDNPLCPIHKNPLDILPCIRKFGEKELEFSAYYCDKCSKVLLRRTAALNLEDNCAQKGIPLISFEQLVQKAPSQPIIPQKELKADYYMDEGKRVAYTFGQKYDCYMLKETDTVIVSDSTYCTLTDHQTETVLGQIAVTERSGETKQYLFMLGYCSECQKYYMDERDYETVYRLGRPQVTILIDSETNSYMVTSGDVFDIEKNHLKDLETIIDTVVDKIHQQPDYISKYAVGAYDDGDLADRKSVSSRKYDERLLKLEGYQPRPYRYRVDISSANEKEVYYIGATDICLDGIQHVISQSSRFGRSLINYKSINIKKTDNGPEYTITLSREFDIEKAKLYGYRNLRTDEDLIFRSGITDPFLVKVLNMRRRQHSLIDIFVTIQENQNAIVDAPFEKNIIVQGCAGSGKTMVLLHRLSSLKYNMEDFNFSQNALILTPNDNFTLHIKGLAESLQIGTIDRQSIEQYYLNTLSAYSKDICPSGKLTSEMTVKQELVDYIYSDEFKASFRTKYRETIDTRNQIVDHMQALLALMGMQPCSIDMSNDSLVIPQLNKILISVSAKISVSEGKFKEATSLLRDLKSRKDELTLSVPKELAEFDTWLTETCIAAPAKANASLLDIQSQINEKQKDHTSVAEEQAQLELELQSSTTINVLTVDEYIQQNIKWIDEQSKAILENITSQKRSLVEKANRREQLKALLSIPESETIKIGTSPDREIQAILDSLNREKKVHNDLLLAKETLENNWSPFRKTRRLALLNSEIQSSESKMFSLAESIEHLYDVRRTELDHIEMDIIHLQQAIDIDIRSLTNIIDQKKKNKLIAVKRKGTTLAREIDEKVSSLRNYSAMVEQLSQDMPVSEKIKLLNGIGIFCPPLKHQVEQCNAKQGSIERHQKELSEMDSKINVAANEYTAALSNRYSEEIRAMRDSIAKSIESNSATSTYREVFTATVAPVKNKLHTTLANGEVHRFDLYARLLFALMFYGKSASRIQFMCIDEGQDLAVNEYALINELNGYDVIFNIFGDTNQLIKPNRGIDDWNKLKTLFLSDLYTLNENYRNTNQITRFCNDNFGMSVAQNGVDGPKIKEISDREIKDELNNLQITNERIAILLPRSKQRKEYIDFLILDSNKKGIIGDVIDNGRIAVMYVDEVKGIEFDKVYVLSQGMDRNEKYIAYTRALSELIIVVD